MKKKEKYTIHQLCHHSFTSYLHIPYLRADSHTIAYLLVDLHWADSLGKTRRNDIRELSGSE